MRYFLCLIGGRDLEISMAEASAIAEASEAGARQLRVAGCVILASSIAAIMPADAYIVAETRRLARQEKFMCHAGEVHELGDKCHCEDSLLADNTAPRIGPQTHTETITRPDGTKHITTVFPDGRKNVVVLPPERL